MANTHTRMRTMLLAASALTGSLSLAIASPAAAQERSYALDLPAQSLSASLMAFGSSTDQQIVFSEAIVKGRAAPKLKGDYTASQALAMLLDDTGLVAQRNGDGVVLITRASDPQSGSAAGDGAEGTVQALIVTAQKREENIQDVPIAMSAFTQEDLTRSQVAGGPDLITQVPNMTFTKTNFSSYSVQLRGIGTQAISATTDPAVAVAFNNTPFIRNRFFEQEFYDLQRVEVLRGPQGTLYGRNATAGVVNIISAKPKFRYEAKLSGDVGNFSSSRLEGMVNIPLVEDKVALRVAGAWTKRDGYAFNATTGAPIDGRNLWSTRVSLRVAPTDGINVNLIWEHFQEDDDRLRSGKQLCKKDVVTQVGDATVTNYYSSLANIGQRDAQWADVQAVLSQGCKRNSLYAQDSFQRPVGLMLPYYSPLGAIGLPVALTDPYVNVTTSHDPVVVSATNDQIANLRTIESTVDPKYRANSDLGELQASFDLPGGLTLQSETAYAVDEVYSLEDFNRFNTAHGAWLQSDARPGVLVDGVFCDPQLGCSDRLVAVDISTATASQFSQELRLSSDFEGPFNFSFGANFLRADSKDKYYVFINSLSLAPVTSFLSGGLTTPYVAGVSDNHGCLLNGYGPGDPNTTYKVQQCTYVEPNSIAGIQDTGHNYFLSNNPYKLISYAVFGETYYQVTEALKVTAGLRWTVDKKEAPRVPTWVLISQSTGYPVADVIEQEWREPTGRLAIDWKPELSFTDQTLLYASFAHGYKAGGANPPGFVRSYYGDKAVADLEAEQSATRPLTFNPEFINAFELGSKNTLDDGKVTVNLAAFYYDYKGYQVSEIVDRSAFNRNFDATVWGVELESDWRPFENLRLGFKGGYEKTRIANGMQAIDLMDRTAGHTDWVVTRPFPTFASSCILPTFLFAHDGPDVGGGTPGLYNVGSLGGGGPTGCELAYFGGVDPVTQLPYVPNPVGNAGSLGYWFPGTYPGWDPTVDYGNNHGEGFFKQLGGNELPNAPKVTLTGIVDYTVPLGSDWLMDLHTDLHWQSQSWWRVFNDNAYDKLHPYFTMNLAAIFTNEDAGWNVMAYIKNVTDETAITGAFLNSDDTGLTTNVFLTEPRLYGLRVTKTWSGGPLLGNFGGRHVGPYPFTLELGGQAQRHDAPTQTLQTAFTQQFAAPLDVFGQAQESDLDWGDGGDVKLTYHPSGGAWQVSASFRRGDANARNHPQAQFDTPSVCALAGSPFAFACAIKPGDPGYIPAIGLLTDLSATNWVDASVIDHEDDQIADLAIGRELAIGGFSQSLVSVGVRHARLGSSTDGRLQGVPDWALPAQGFYFPGAPATHTEYDIRVAADRKFDGAGPVVTWEASYPLLDRSDSGRVGVDWSVTAGALFGDQKTTVSVVQKADRYNTNALTLGQLTYVDPVAIPVTAPAPIDLRRSKSVTVPTATLSLGLSYEVDRFKVGAGYRWERYFNVLDAGYAEREEVDRTIDGPYFKVAVGFGG